MNPAYLSAISALAGSAIGALASFATTWLTQHNQDITQRRSLENTRRERLYGDFIDEAGKLFAHALTHDFEDPAKLVQLSALTSKLRLFASPQTIVAAEAVMQAVVETYYRPNEDFREFKQRDPGEFDFLRDFTAACREDLRG